MGLPVPRLAWPLRIEKWIMSETVQIIMTICAVMLVQMPGTYLGLSCKREGIVSFETAGHGQRQTYLLAERNAGDDTTNTTEADDERRGVRTLSLIDN